MNCVHKLQQNYIMFSTMASNRLVSFESQFRTIDLILKKRNGESLSNEEIQYFVQEVVKKSMQEVQLGAMLMAICCQNLNRKEISYLTRAMTSSGDVLLWPAEWKGTVVDKHSTGGVGDKISIVLAPALAACGLKVPMISGRSLGHTGGTLDKLESIPGYRVDLTYENMLKILTEVGCCIVSQSDSIVPADKIMYATRNITATIDCIGLITASIISKKAAESLDALVLDVKFGAGAFYKTEKEARKLAIAMMQTCIDLGMKTMVLLTDMSTPLGYMIGNALEVAEAVECLHGKGPRDIRDLVVELGGRLVYLAGKATTLLDAYDMIEQTLCNGTALEKFVAMLKMQGVDTRVADNLCANGEGVWTVLPTAKYSTEIKSKTSGHIHDIDAMRLANVTVKLGAGRFRAEESINSAVGLQLRVQVGDEVSEGSNLLQIHHDEENVSTEYISMLEEAIVIKDAPLPTSNNGHKSSRVLDVIKT